MSVGILRSSKSKLWWLVIGLKAKVLTRSESKASQSHNKIGYNQPPHTKVIRHLLSTRREIQIMRDIVCIARKMVVMSIISTIWKLMSLPSLSRTI